MARPSSSERARRLIALLGQLDPGRRIRLADLAQSLGVSEAQIAADLETLSVCGVAPYDPLGLIPVFIDGDEVVVFGEVPALKAGVRLSAAEAEALSAALQAAGFGSDDRLTARLLEAASSSFTAEELERVLVTRVGAHDRGVYEVLADAIAQHVAVELEHTPSGAEEIRRRVVEPCALFAERGAWYLTAWCRTAGSWRTFRLDRIRSARATGEAARASLPARGSLSAMPSGGASDELPRARLRFSPADGFVEREWPGAVVKEATENGVAIVDVPYAGTQWIARHIVARLGEVEVLEPVEVREAVRSLGTQLLEEA